MATSSSDRAAWSDSVLDLTDRDLKAVSRLVYEKSGITLHAGKKALVTARLQKRVRQGGFETFARYLKHVEADASGDELTALLDAIATNHTSFFREAQHFDFLRDTVLPPLAAKPGGPRIRGWSAACSTGEEPYTLAMTCLERFGAQAADRVHLLASDLSTKALKAARAGVYKADRVTGLPYDVLRRHFEKGLGAQAGTVRVKPAVRHMIEYRQINLLDPVTPGPFEFIFCRNVMIYFDGSVQQRVVRALEQRLAPGGYLFISHSESLNGVTHGLRWVAPAIYRRSPA
jgi:chemotaxis protein methyltransferase CheR